MDISGLIQSYDSRSPSSAAMTRAIMAPQYAPAHQYSGPPQNTMIAANQQIQHHNPFTFGGAYSGSQSANIVPAFAANYIQQQPLPRSMQRDNGVRAISYSRDSRRGYIEEHHSQSPSIKSEPLWGVSTEPSTSVNFPSTDAKPVSANTSPVTGPEVNFGTDVDTLMKAIQAKSQTSAIPTPAIEQSAPVVGLSPSPPFALSSNQTRRYGPGDANPISVTRESQQKGTNSSKSSKKRYQCTVENCTKKFQQKTHLDIHERSHTGVKPFVRNSTCYYLIYADSVPVGVQTSRLWT
jgi:hypothetical protein